MKKKDITQAKADRNKNSFEPKDTVMGSPVKKIPGIKSIKDLFGFK